MSETLTKIIVDCSTGVVAEVPLTGEEIAQREADVIAAAEQEALKDAAVAAEEAARESAKAKLATLGLTPEEIAALSK
jgi:hypothetical protein